MTKLTGFQRRDVNICTLACKLFQSKLVLIIVSRELDIVQITNLVLLAHPWMFSIYSSIEDTTGDRTWCHGRKRTKSDWDSNPVPLTYCASPLPLLSRLVPESPWSHERTDETFPSDDHSPSI